ncbi:hypothetical protein [Sphingobium boeckii]|uniref:Uncharacterized protein n=1 Tax=Sphingobium boeckii TaxID=1082345 RepID=A0A7W9AFZ8_9SPHN|nr:hypothetical protein [Sphingobium boeckii]MBB5684967.1 hypothetical protein [Sphingobium boeckii]
MTSNTPPLTLEAVLDHFQMEEIHDGDVLARYVQAHPQFALQLIDLSRLIATSGVEDESPLSATEQSRIDTAWIAHKAAGPEVPPAGDPLAALVGEPSKALARKLGVPRQVITCFREHKVKASSVPGHVLQDFADALNVPAAHVIAAMQQPPSMAMGRSYKSDGKPGSGEQDTFEQVLIDAGVSETDRARLLAGVA